MTNRPRRPFDDVVLRWDDTRREDDDDEDAGDLTLSPTDPETDLARQSMREAEQAPSLSVVNSEAEDAKSPAAPFQFSIRHVLIGNVVLAVALAVLRLIAPEMVAVALGMLAFAVLIAVQVLQPADKRVYGIATALIAIYAVVAIVALLVGPRG